MSLALRAMLPIYKYTKGFHQSWPLIKFQFERFKVRSAGEICSKNIMHNLKCSLLLFYKIFRKTVQGKLWGMGITYSILLKIMTCGMYLLKVYIRESNKLDNCETILLANRLYDTFL